MVKRNANIWRILDSSANRASEGLRTIEEHARFGLGDSFLSQQLKDLRHDVANVCGMLPRERLLQSRDTPGDVGTKIETVNRVRARIS